MLFCNKLSEKEGLKSCYVLLEGLEAACKNQVPYYDDAVDALSKKVKWKRGANGYRFLTEAEWEYCARGGEGHLYSGSNNIDDVAWFGGNSGKQTHLVGEKKANGFGLYDMSGNVWEWCWDSWIRTYTTATQKDPVFVNKDSRSRIFRGGSWSDDPLEARNANRGGNFSTHRSSRVGFRFLRMIV